jgi:acyl-CoA thioesterase-1
MSRLIGSLAALYLIVFAGAAQAQHIKIVALGDSNFGAPGVSRSEAYPAQIESLLRARGVDDSVSNQGINGDTTSGVLVVST